MFFQAPVLEWPSGTSPLLPPMWAWKVFTANIKEWSPASAESNPNRVRLLTHAINEIILTVMFQFKGPSTLATLFNHMWPRIVADPSTLGRHVCYVCKRSVCGGNEPQPVAYLSHKLQCARQNLKIMVSYGNKYPRHNARPHVVEQSGQCAWALRKIVKLFYRNINNVFSKKWIPLEAFLYRGYRKEINFINIKMLNILQ